MVFQVRYYSKGMETNSSSVLSKTEEATITSLKQMTNYGFEVRAKTALGWGDYSPPIFKKTGRLMKTRKLILKNLYFFVTFITFLCFGSFCIQFFLNKKIKDCSYLMYVYISTIILTLH